MNQNVPLAKIKVQTQKRNSLMNIANNHIIKKISSNLNLKENLQTPFNLSKTLVISATSLSSYFSTLLSTSNGRDKVLSCFQYGADFFQHCAKYSNIQVYREKVIENSIEAVRIAYSTKESLSQARKTFRLFKFFDEIKGLQRIIKNKKPWLFKSLSILISFCSIMYYVSDNLLFGLQILIMRKQQNIIQQINSSPNIKMQVEDDSYSLSQKLIRQRRKIRFDMLNIFIDSMRFFMLYRSLPFYGAKNFNPVFASFCGLGSSILNVIKTIFEKKIFIQLETGQIKVPKILQPQSPEIKGKTIQKVFSETNNLNLHHENKIQELSKDEEEEEPEIMSPQSQQSQFSKNSKVDVDAEDTASSNKLGQRLTQFSLGDNMVQITTSI